MLDFRVETFLMVCKYQNFTRAAEALHITQPAVSQHIRQLEEDCRVKLFDHRGKRLALTEEGELFLSAAATMQHDAACLQEKLRQMQHKRRRLIFGATLTIGEFVLPARVAAYMGAHPETSIKLVIANTHELLRRVNEGEIDFAVVEGYFEKGEYDSLPYRREPYLAVCSAQQPLSPAPRTVEDLLNERLIVRESGSGTREILERTLEESNRHIRDFADVAEVGSIGAIKSLVAAGCGITFLYETAVQEELRNGSLRVIPLEGFPLFHQFTFLWRKGSVFAEDYREAFAALCAGPDVEQEIF